MKQQVISATQPHQTTTISSRGDPNTLFHLSLTKKVNYYTFFTRILWFQCKTKYTLCVLYLDFSFRTYWLGSPNEATGYLCNSAPPKDHYKFQIHVFHLSPTKKVKYYTYFMRVIWFQCKTKYMLCVLY